MDMKNGHEIGRKKREIYMKGMLVKINRMR